MPRASELPYGSPVRTKEVAPMPEAQGISNDREVRLAVDQGIDASDRRREVGPIESSCSSSGFEISGAHNIATFCLLEKDCRVVGRVGVPAMMGDGFVCLHKVGFVFLLFYFAFV